MGRKTQSYLHVTIQFSALFFIILSGPVFLSGVYIIVEISGLLLGVWSVWTMRKSYISIFPEPHKKFILVEQGPYRIIRHPMYLALFLVLLPMVIEKPVPVRICMIGIFIVNQLIKLLYEEKLIEKEIPGYQEYKNRTWRLIPFLF
jgi:protein-S-isoprenylcysteine O-methyltransferase Ste14